MLFGSCEIWAGISDFLRIGTVILCSQTFFMVRPWIIVEQEGRFVDSKDITKQASTEFWEIVIMRRYVVSIAVLLMVMTAAGTALAQEKKEKGKGKSRSPLLVQPRGRKTPEELGRRKRVDGAEAGAEHRSRREGMARGMLHREQLRKLDKQLEQRRSKYESFVGELKAIKELALQEKAAKTAERLQKLIDTRTGLFNEDVRKLETRRDNIRERVEKQAEGRLKRRELLMQREKERLEKDKGKDKGQGKDKSEAKP